MKLHTYFRSSAAYRVRIVLALKGLAWQAVPVHLVRGGGEQNAPAYRAVNPHGLVPALETDGAVLIQSTAICEYLEEAHREPPLLPGAPLARAYVRAVMATIACEIHPLNNLRVLAYLTGPLGHGEADRTAWYRHWIAEGLTALEGYVARSGLAGRYVCGDRPTLADAFLVPQLYNARRFDCPLDAYPTLTRIDAAARDLPAFREAAPEAQADAG
ncbi:maleylacetoacetate isomerase [Aquibium sp. A9E412]|uniref:maleylacetoacetate isomerase n=1 Tax=Aquibium sp. A9E412 TaxID=2976767 RepID=UPI0025AF21CF|nr:maleylacetoacetate isomerase [Aquibium sp. A9E412]MDN2566620.1 maleylacetoacetate isomerase [Aquibium sp. A9E412]